MTERLDRQLHDLADRVALPVTPLADDLARGRRRVRRVRAALVGATAVVAVAVVGGVGIVVGTRGHDAGRAPVVVDPPDPTPAQASDVGVPWPSQPERRRQLREFQEVLAERLDPAGEHLEPWGPSNGEQSGGTVAEDRLTGTGTKLSWTNPGEDGLGMLQIYVSQGWDLQFNWTCAGGCRDVTPPDGAVSAQVHERGGVLEVGVEHADGNVVVLSADPLFGNNSTVPVSSIDLTEDQLLQAAADPRLALPGVLAPQPPALTAEQLEAAADVLTGGRLDVRSVWSTTGFDASWVVDGQVRGRISLSADRAGVVDVADATCPNVLLIACHPEEVDGQGVLVGEYRPKWGGGPAVSFTGPSYEISYRFRPDGDATGPALDEVIALVTDPALQPTP
jgi:hypothetical protein